MGLKIPRTGVAMMLLAVSGLVGCSERDLDSLSPAPISDDPLVFDDALGAGVDYQAFMGSLLDAVAVDNDAAQVGAASLRVTVPGPGAEGGTFAGGAFTSSDHRDLSSYDALTFWARSSIGQGSTLNVAGLGNDNTGTSLYEVQRQNIPLTDDWSQVVIPIPDPSRLTMERGLFFFAEGHENNEGFTMWFDEIRFIRMGSTITDPRPAMATRTIESFIGATVTPAETRVTFSVNGVDVTVDHSHRYFDYMSSDEDVVRVVDGNLTVVGGGEAVVTAMLDNIDVEGTIIVNVLAPPSEPAPMPTYPQNDVIALFSDAYQTVPVDTWRADWSMSGPVEDIEIEGNAVKVYTGLVYAGVEFTSQLIDASDMTHLRLDVWAPAGSVFRVKLVDFGADGAFGGGDDQERELVFHGSSEPAFMAEQWSILDIPLDNFSLTNRSHLAQLIISSPDAPTVFVDNVLLHR